MLHVPSPVLLLRESGIGLTTGEEKRHGCHDYWKKSDEDSGLESTGAAKAPGRENKAVRQSVAAANEAFGDGGKKVAMGLGWRPAGTAVVKTVAGGERRSEKAGGGRG